MSNLSMVLDEMIQYGQGILSCVEELKKSGDGLVRIATEIKEIFTTDEPLKATKIAKQETPSIPKKEGTNNQPAAKTYSFIDVRRTLAAKSKDGFKEDVKKLISKYGAEKLSDINLDDYAALIKDAEGLGNG